MNIGIANLLAKQLVGSFQLIERQNMFIRNMRAQYMVVHISRM